MAKFKVKVVVKAQYEYEVEVEIGSNRETEADAEARALWKDMAPADFRVNKGYVTDIEVDDTQQLTGTCERCSVEFPLIEGTPSPMPLNVPQQWYEDGDFCAKCGLEIEAEDEAAEERRQIRIAAARAATMKDRIAYMKAGVN